MRETRKLLFDEKLYPSSAFLLTIQTLPLAFWLICLPVWPKAALFVGVLADLALLVGSVALAPRIAFDGESISVGKARLEKSAIGKIEIFRGAAAQRARTLDLNPKAWLKLRPGINSYLKLNLNDPNDPTPYWLFSTRKPELLAEVLCR